MYNFKPFRPSFADMEKHSSHIVGHVLQHIQTNGHAEDVCPKQHNERAVMLDTLISVNDSYYFCILDNQNAIRLSEWDILACKLYDAIYVVPLIYQVVVSRSLHTVIYA